MENFPLRNFIIIRTSASQLSRPSGNSCTAYPFAQGLYASHAYTFEALHVLAIPTMSVNPNEYLLIYAALIRNPHGRRDRAWNPFKDENGQLIGSFQDLHFLADPNGQSGQLDLTKPQLTETLVHLLNVPQDVLPNEAGFGTDAKMQRELLWRTASPFYILKPGCVEGKGLNSQLKKLPLELSATNAEGGAAADPYLRTLQLPLKLLDGPTPCMKLYSRQQISSGKVSGSYEWQFSATDHL